MSKVGLYVKFTAREGRRDEMAARLLAAAELMAGAPGCDVYIVGEAPDEPDVVWVTEVWRSEDDHEASLDLPGVRGLIEQAMPLMARAPERIDSVPLGGVGLGD